MSKILDGLLYSESHEWIKKLSDDEVLIGITEFAAEQLGSIVFVDLPEVEDSIEKDSEFGAVESVKAASDLVAPVTGIVLEMNEDLVSEPELVNEDAFGAWFLKIKLENPEELDGLLSPEEYKNFI
ncbi:MAG: glycine cleavage system protein GcvH [Tenericutes bacterium]|nr:glycine cleavage system protein GcvH [Mycoplasmatota bacterium]